MASNKTLLLTERNNNESSHRRKKGDRSGDKPIAKPVITSAKKVNTFTFIAEGPKEI